MGSKYAQQELLESTSSFITSGLSMTSLPLQALPAPPSPPSTRTSSQLVTLADTITECLDPMTKREQWLKLKKQASAPPLSSIKHTSHFRASGNQNALPHRHATHIGNQNALTVPTAPHHAPPTQPPFPPPSSHEQDRMKVEAPTQTKMKVEQGGGEAPSHYAPSFSFGLGWHAHGPPRHAPMKHEPHTHHYHGNVYNFHGPCYPSDVIGSMNGGHPPLLCNGNNSEQDLKEEDEDLWYMTSDELDAHYGGTI